MRSVILSVCCGPVLFGGLPAAAGTEPGRLVQIGSVDLDAGVVEIRNYGAAAIPLDGFRFCSHSAQQALRYTNASGLAGRSLAPDGSLFVHLFDDAPPLPDAVNVSAIGVFANRFGQGPYAIQLFWPNGGDLNFGSPDDVADHVQWNVGGIGNGVADARSQQAVNAGVWMDASSWIATTGATTRFELNAPLPLAQDASSFTTFEVFGGCSPADVAEPFDVLDLSDITGFITAFLSMSPVADIAGPTGVFDLNDVIAFVEVYRSGCP